MELLWSVAAPSQDATGILTPLSSARSDLTNDILQPHLASPACEGDGTVLEDCAAVCETSPPLCAMSPLAGLSDEEMLRAMIKSEPWKELLRAVKPEASVIYGYEYVNPLLFNGQQRNAHKSLGRESRCCDECENSAGASAQSHAAAPDKIHFVWPAPGRARGALDALSAVVEASAACRSAARPRCCRAGCPRCDAAGEKRRPPGSATPEQWWRALRPPLDVRSRRSRRLLCDRG